MREIKFRLRIGTKIVGYEKWYPGKRQTQEDPTGAIPQWLYSKDGEYWNPDYIYHEVKDHHTGLKDKNGKRIYEEDIVEFKGHYTGKRTLISRVVWSDTAARWGLRHGPEKDYATMWPEMVHWMEVVGNIHENSGLFDN